MPANSYIYRQKLARIIDSTMDNLVRLDEMTQHPHAVDATVLAYLSSAKANLENAVSMAAKALHNLNVVAPE